MNPNPKKNLEVLQYNAVFQEEADSTYSVWVPSLPGCCSQGKNLNDAIINIKEAIELYLEDQPSHNNDDSQNKQFLSSLFAINPPLHRLSLSPIIKPLNQAR